ncbi:MAG TPA: Tc toxin subunit A, partial [Ktedonobacteraceae bacterium]|nr:Tc toxin subunit A [Ktedonobacteraceae bacterium]
YTPKQFRRSNEEEADLIVRVFDDAGNVLVASPVFFDAPREQTIDLMVGGLFYRGASEYEQLVTKITPLLDSVQPADLSDDDVSFLASETKESSTYISYFALANKLAQDTHVPSEALYGFFREGLPTDLPSLLSHKLESLRRALEQALADNIVPLKLSTQLDDILKQLHQLLAAQAFTPPEQTGGASLGSLLGVTLAKKALQEKFLTLFVQHPGPIENFWQSLAQEPEFQGNTVPQLQLMIQLGAITRNHVPLVQALQQSGTVGSVKDLAKLDESAWYGLLNTQVNGQVVGFPADVPGTGADEKAATYAHTLARTVEEIIPSAVVAHRIGKDNVPGKADLVTFFANNQDFDFVTTHIDSYLAEKGSTALRGVQDVNILTAHLKEYQRVFNVTHRYDEMRLLQTHGIHSALHISGLGRDTFIAQYDSLLEQNRAAAIFDRADYLSAKVLNVYGTYSAATNKVALPLVLDPLTAMTRANGFEEGGPNLTTLFGTQDYCNCDDCRSMLSQAAYLVDILSFLAPATQANLLAATRRPDLGEIELSCSNTQTLLPQIDLVNEVLERAVTLNAGGTLPPAGSWPQTTWTADELRTNPEHPDENAYAILARTFYSWPLPFDLAAEEARTYLGQLGLQRDLLMRTFQKRPQGATFDPIDLDIASEYLHLSPLEQDIIAATPVVTVAVRAATTGPITLSGLQTIDGVALADG